jgi:hypothetical protein
MSKQRAIVIVAGAALTAFATPAAAQVPDNVVLNVMRECAKIDDPTARLACYDNNIRSAGGNPRSVPGQGGVVRGGGAPISGNPGGGPEGFGADSIRTEERFQSYEERGLGPDEISARITAVSQREPGVYLVTIDGDAQWLFAESMGISFQPPRRGDTVRIERGALGSFLMHVDDQEPVRVRRVR